MIKVKTIDKKQRPLQIKRSPIRLSHYHIISNATYHILFDNRSWLPYLVGHLSYTSSVYKMCGCWDHVQHCREDGGGVRSSSSSGGRANGGPRPLAATSARGA